MGFFDLSFLSSFSIIIAVIIGLVRYKRIDKTSRPFIIICIVGLCNELFSFILIYAYHAHNAINSNIYILAEALLFVWLFQCWGDFRKRSWYYYLLIFLLIGIWVFDNIIWNHITTFNSLFRIFYSFCLLFLSINQVNKLILQARGSLLRNYRFLICIGVLIYYSYKATIEVFYMLKLELSDNFYTHIYFIMDLINIFVNLLYALAILWIPKKQKFILPY